MGADDHQQAEGHQTREEEGIVNSNRLCPVCLREIKRTMHHNIPRHFDSLHADVCPGSGEPIRIAIEVEFGYEDDARRAA